MRGDGIDQWDDVYPDLQAVEQNVADGTLYVALEDDRCLGSVCLSEEQDEAYKTVRWSGSEPVLVVHRLCVSPSEQRRGVASLLMDFAEAKAAEFGYASIRLDAYTGNPQAVALYARRGYSVAGEVRFPRRAHPFKCMEKTLHTHEAV
jgi:GNAT superfamily N-acetyltransferase